MAAIPVPADVSTSSGTLDGIPAVNVEIARADHASAIFYLHGGQARDRMTRVNDRGSVRVVEERGRLDADALRELSRRLDGYRKSTHLGSGWDRGMPGDCLDALLEDW
ncbi:MAG TPA: hypothetical protein VMP89_17425, partial [Solirubrobacteraceae bacterium]|nr:hypothetical protein [Solirubrobacteraceae bacterium]